jgi:glycosyltransferase involved in cell wall biosynthesis
LKILFLSAWYPYPADNGSKLRVYHLLRGLAEEHEVTLLSFTEEATTATPPALATLCRQVYTVPRLSYQPGSWRALAGLFSQTPRSVLDTYQPLMAEMIGCLLREESYDLVIASQWWTAVYWATFSHRPSLYEEVEIGIFTSQIAQAATLRQKVRHRLTLNKLQGYLRRQLPHFRACTVVSETEKELLHRLVPDYQATHVIPNGMSLAGEADNLPRPQPDTLIFSGSLSYAANYEGMNWFIEEIYPLIQAEAPAVKIMITGKAGERPLPPAANVTLTGFVEDVRPLIASAWISLAPIRLGGGTRLKILEAMALGTPVVTTSKGAEGLAVKDGEHLLIGDTPEAFAAAVLRLLKNPPLRRQLADNACQLISQQYDWAIIMPEFLRVVETVTHG